MAREYDQYIMVMEGKLGLKVFPAIDDNKDEAVWSGTLNTEDFAYIPKGIMYQLRNKVDNDNDNCVILTLMSHKNN